MSVESSTRTVYSLTTNRTRISLLHHPSSSGVLRFRNFVKYYIDPDGNSDVYVVKADNQDEAIGQVLSNRAIVPGDEKPVDIVLFEGGSGSATGGGGGGAGYAGEAFETISAPDINGNITFTKGDGSTQVINMNDIRLNGVSYDSISKSLTFTMQDEEGNSVSTINVPLTDLVDTAPDNLVCYKVTDSSNPLTSYSFTNSDIAHFGIGGEFKFRTLTVNGVESAEQNIFYYDTATDEFIPANYPLIVNAIKAHLDAEGVSYESVDFNVLDNGDGTHTTEVIILSTDNSIPTGASFQVKYNRAFQVNSITAFADGPIDNEKFYKRISLDGTEAWLEWNNFEYVALGSAPDFTGLTVEIAHCKDMPAISLDAGNRVQKRDDGIFVPPVASPGTEGYTRYRGQINAATASLPTDAQLGDYWYVSTDGNNLGNIEGVDYLSKGDYVTYLNLSGDDDRSNPQNWTGHQRNTDDRFTNLVSIEDDLQTVNLVALTPLQVNAVNLFFGDIRDVTLRDTNDFVITDGVSIQIFPKPNAGAPPYVLLTSNQNLTGVKVYLRGRPA